MQVFKSAVFFTLLAPGLLAAQEVVISGKDFESGAGDAKLAEIARQAAASGKTVIVSTPPYWQDKAVSKLKSSSPDVHLKTSDAFFENVIVRIVSTDKPDKPDKPEKAAVKPVEEPAPVAAPISAPVVVKAPPVKPAPKVDPVEEAATAAAAAPKPAKVDAPAAAVATVPASAPVTAPAPAPVAPPAEPAPVAVAPAPEVPAEKPAPAPVVVASATPAPAVATARPTASESSIAEQRKKVEAQLGGGRAADGVIKPNQLQKGDELFVRGPIRAVLRRFGPRVQLYWLEGVLDVQRAELSMTEPGHYRVDDQIRDVASPSLRALHLEPNIFAAEVPAPKSPMRIDMERHFNDAKNISDSLRPDQLQYGDLFYVFRKHAVVFRRTEYGFSRYWLEGSVDLNQAGIVKDGDAYRLVSDRL